MPHFHALQALAACAAATLATSRRQYQPWAPPQTEPRWWPPGGKLVFCGARFLPRRGQERLLLLYAAQGAHTVLQEARTLPPRDAISRNQSRNQNEGPSPKVSAPSDCARIARLHFCAAGFRFLSSHPPTPRYALSISIVIRHHTLCIASSGACLLG